HLRPRSRRSGPRRGARRPLPYRRFPVRGPAECRRHMTARETVLLLDGQTTQALACARSLGRAGYRVLVASHRRRPLAAWSRFAHAVFVLEDQSVPAFAAARAWAARQGARVVLPLTDRKSVV